MLFNSIEFALFLPITFVIYWFVVGNNLKIQNLFLVAAGYFFYAWWDWRFLSLLILSSLIDFGIGLTLSKTESKNKRKIILWLSILMNIGILGFFKYFNFFIDSFQDAFTFFGYQIEAHHINLILPLGISFYTFQTLSYTIDVYKGKMKATNDVVAFLAFICFFPQLVAGPIERAANLLPQFYKKRIFEYAQASDGVRQILWGLFKKVVISNNCSIYVAEIFTNYDSYSGSTLFLGTVFFAFQIYADFSGYSDMAIGTARLFGFDLMKNFNFPYFSSNIAEFWRRWHISLTTWFRDYIYYPLGGSLFSKWKTARNVMIIFLVSGFWHGANWTFLVWGFLNALYFLPSLLLERKKEVNSNKWSIQKPFKILGTFFIVCVAWVFFRAPNVSTAFQYLNRLFSSSFFELPSILTPKLDMVYLMFNILFLIGIEWIQQEKEHGLDLKNVSTIKRRILYLLVFSSILLFGTFGKEEFIYFQF